MSKLKNKRESLNGFSEVNSYDTRRSVGPALGRRVHLLHVLLVRDRRSVLALVVIFLLDEASAAVAADLHLGRILRELRVTT